MRCGQQPAQLLMVDPEFRIKLNSAFRGEPLRAAAVNRRVTVFIFAPRFLYNRLSIGSRRSLQPVDSDGRTTERACHLCAIDYISGTGESVAREDTYSIDLTKSNSGMLTIRHVPLFTSLRRDSKAF